MHGKMANSVTTAVTKLAGVTSYTIFKRFNNFFVLQFVNNDFCAPLPQSCTSSSAFPVNKLLREKKIKNT